MARAWFGGTSADGVFGIYALGSRQLLELTRTTLRFYDTETGGTQYVDLLDKNGAATSSIVTDLGHVPAFQGPDGVTKMWADDGDSQRHLMVAQGRQGPEGPQGPAGPQGQMATGAAEDDAAIAGFAGTPGSATNDVLSASYAAKGSANTFTAGQTFNLPNDTTVGAPPMVSAVGQINTTETTPADYPLIKADANYLATDASSPFDVAYLGIFSNLNYGSTTTAALGTAHSTTAILNVKGSGSADNEFASSYRAMRFDNGRQGRAWLADWNLHGPISAQPSLLNGLTALVNNHYNGPPSGGPSGHWLVTKPGAGGGGSPDHASASTYKLDVGLGIVGYAGTQAGPTRGFEVGIQVGGYGSGWMANTEASKIGTGIRLLNVESAAIKIESDSVAGAITWGPASGAAADVNLYRSAANMLKTDDDFTCSTLYATSGLLVGSTTNDVFAKYINNRLNIPTARFRNVAAGNTADVVQVQDGAGATNFVFDKDARPKWNTAAMVQTTVGAAGAASALPAAPTKYLKVVDEAGTVLVIPAYAAS